MDGCFESTALGINQRKCREKCRTISHEKMHVQIKNYNYVIDALNEILYPIWNKFDLVAPYDKDYGGNVILVNSNGEGVKLRERFESLLSVFTLSLHPIKELILDGSYIQAGILIRSSIENTIQFKNILADEYKDKKTPNIKSLSPEMKISYSNITGLAHLSDEELLKKLTRGRVDGSNSLVTPLLRTLTPYFDEEEAKYLFSLLIVSAIENIILINEYLELVLPRYSAPAEYIYDLMEIRLIIKSDIEE
jgi:hypothetical protein